MPPPCLLHSQVTPEKLEEFKTRIPRAGPKYRLGMYFETIHDLSEFEEVHGPEDGYSSCWDTETDFDSELGNFIFHNVSGDSASVICIDEAMDLLAMREEQQQMKLQMEEARRKGVGNDVGGELAKLGPGDFEEYTFDQQSDGKRSGGASRHSHHSGSDGTYDGPQRTPFHMTHIATCSPEEPEEEHIYETLDSCQEHHFHMYISSKGSVDSQHSAAKQPGNASDNDSDKTPSVRKSSPTKSTSFRAMFGKNRTTSLEQATALPKREKLNLKKKMSLDSQERGAQIAPKQYSVPLKGYATEKTAPPLPTKRSSQEKMSTSASSPTSRGCTHNTASPSLVIKHKGKTYIIPVKETKKEGKSKQTGSSSKRVHNVLCTTKSNPFPYLNSQPPTTTNVANGSPVPPSTGTLKKLTSHQVAPHDVCDGVSCNRRRKSQPQTSCSVPPPSKHSTAVNTVTHYGML